MSYASVVTALWHTMSTENQGTSFQPSWPVSIMQGHFSGEDDSTPIASPLCACARVPSRIVPIAHAHNVTVSWLAL